MRAIHGWIVAAILALLVAAAPASAAPVVWGIHSTANLDGDYWSYVATLEGELGRQFNGLRKNGLTNDVGEVDRGIDLGRGASFTYMNGKPGSKSAKGRYWLDVAAGRYDTALRAFFARVDQDARFTAGHPLYYSFHHEQQVTGEGGGATAGTAADYVRAYRRVSSMARAALGEKVRMCWTPLWSQFYFDGTGRGQSAYYASKVWPGAGYVDVVGADVYVQADSAGTGLQYTAAQQWTPVRDFAVRVGRPWFTGETGVEVTGRNDAAVVAYLRQLDGLLKSWGGGYDAGQVVAVNWTSRLTYPTTKHIDDRMDVRPVVFDQYRVMALDAFYGG